MSCSKTSTGDYANDIIRKTVRVAVEGGGTNWTGATSELAAWLGLSDRTVRARCRDELTGPPKGDVIARCWSFMDAIAAKQRAWLARLEAEIATKRAADAQSNLDAAADSLARAQDAMADYHKAKQMRG